MQREHSLAEHDEAIAVAVQTPTGPLAMPLGPPRPSASRPVRGLLVALGSVALALGVVGLVIPVLPTTPFLLLAAACYARASDRLYAWLIGQPALGPVITEWRSSRSLPPGVKVRALVVVAVTFAVSVVLVDHMLVRAGLVAIGLVLSAFLIRIPTRGR